MYERSVGGGRSEVLLLEEEGIRHEEGPPAILFSSGRGRCPNPLGRGRIWGEGGRRDSARTHETGEDNGLRGEWCRGEEQAKTLEEVNRGG